MIINKNIKFGYGSILIVSDWIAHKLTINHIDKIKPIGSSTLEDIKDVNVIDKVEFKYNKDMYSLLHELENVSENNPIIQFRGYNFDFSNYNKGSVDVLKKQLLKVIQSRLLLLAV